LGLDEYKIYLCVIVFDTPGQFRVPFLSPLLKNISFTHHKQLTVMTRAEKPYVMIKDGNFTGNDMFEGFCIDLLKGIAAQVGFQYNIKLVPDNTYGIFNPDTKMWNGIGK
jgi:Ligated ion channel L-glutamate- and glycine-binding site